MSFIRPNYLNVLTNSEQLTKLLLDRLNPSDWPFAVEDLPIGSALVGGAVRDGLLNSISKNPDLDFIVPVNAVILAKKLANCYGGTCVILDEERDVGRLVIKGWTIDFARQIGNNLNDDLSRRDYTINSIALTLESSPKILDPFNGLKDLKDNTLVALSEENLIDDPLRLIRGLRLMSQLNLTIERKTKDFLSLHSKLLRTVAPERIKNEIQKLVKGTWADDAIFILDEIDLLDPWRNKSKVFIREFNYLQDAKNFELHELEIALPLARLVHLLSDSGLVNLKFSKKEIQRCQTLRKWKRRNDGLGFQTLKESDLFALHIELEKYLPALILDLPKDHQEIWLRRWRDNQDPLFHPSSPLDGLELQRILGIAEGPIIGEIIECLSLEKAFNRLHNPQEAVQLARYLWKQKQPLL